MKIISDSEIAIENKTIERGDFLKQVGIGFGAIMLMNCLQSCSEGEIPDPVIPTTGTKLDITLDLTVSANSNLKTKGGFVVVAASKVIAARTNADTFIAVSSECTHQQTTIAFRAATTDFKCPLHGSEFTATGAVQTGPATSALKKYSTTFDATNNKLRIFE